MSQFSRAVLMPAALAALVLAGCDGSPTASTAPVASEPKLAASPLGSEGRVVYPAGHDQILTLPDGTRRVVHSLLDIDRPMRFGDFVWNDAGIPPGPVWLRVDLSRQMISIFRGRHEIGTAVILFGADDKPTPLGVFPVLAKAKMHESSLYDAEMPYMLRLTGDGVAIHASTVRKWAATHGCIGVPLDFARRLYDVVRRGDAVAIVGAAAGAPKSSA